MALSRGGTGRRLALAAGLAMSLCQLASASEPAPPQRPADARSDINSDDRSDTPARRTIVGSFDFAPGRMHSTSLLVRAFDADTSGPNLGFRRMPLPLGPSPRQFAEMAVESGLFEMVMPNWLLMPAGSAPDAPGGGRGPANDPFRTQQWHLDTIRAEAAWSAATGNPSVVVAFVDTGIDLDHPDLASRLVPGFNVASGFPVPQSAGGAVDDISGHGTVVAGVAAAITDNGLGIAGVGYDLSIMPIRVTDFTNGAALLDNVLLGISVAASAGADIICVGYEGVEQPAAQVVGAFAAARGALVVWPTGNAGRYYDFDHPDVLVVGGSAPGDALYADSNYGPGVDVVAPAWKIRSTRRGGGYGDQNGTSYAGPVAAGIAGLIASVDPTLSPREIAALIQRSSVDLEAPGRDDRSGAGRVDLATAVRMATGMIAEPCVDGSTGLLPASPQRLAPLDGAWVCWTSEFPSFSMAEVQNAPSIRSDVSEDFSPSDIDPPHAARGVVVRGLIEAPQTGTYTIGIAAEPTVGVRLRVGDRCVADRLPSEGGPTGGRITLEQGLHPVTLVVFDGSREFDFELVLGFEDAEPEAVGDAVRRPRSADLNRDDSLTGADFFLFLDLFDQQDPRVDFDGDNLFKGADFFAFLSQFQDASF